MWRTQGRTTVIALAAALALGGCTSSGKDVGTIPSPTVDPASEQLAAILEVEQPPLVLEDDPDARDRGVGYFFWLNGAETEWFEAGRIPPGIPDREFEHNIAWSGVSTFAVDLTNVPARRVITAQRPTAPPLDWEVNCREFAWRSTSEEVRWQKRSGDRESVDVKGEPFVIWLIECPQAVVTVS
jgi:hypothetical protein